MIIFIIIVVVDITPTGKYFTTLCVSFFKSLSLNRMKSYAGKGCLVYTLSQEPRVIPSVQGGANEYPLNDLRTVV